MKNLTKSLAFLSLAMIFSISCSQKAQESSKFDSKVLPTPLNNEEEVATKKSDSDSKTSSDDEEFFIPSDTCKEIEDDENKLLCDSIIEDNDWIEGAQRTKFSYLHSRVDLNGDGEKDAIVWVNDLCGTSGCQISFYRKSKEKFERIYDEQGWTPIVLLDSKTNGWKDLAYQIAGGGVEPHYEILQFDGKSYRFKKSQKQQPKGKIILDKNWKQSVFGPIPNQ